MQLGVAFGGAMLGKAVGMPAIGWLAGTLAGSFLSPGAEEDNSSKLNDLKVSSSSYGKMIPMTWGTNRQTGNMFWATEHREEKEYYNSKGKNVTGKKKDDKKGTPVYTYYANFAMGLCEGPMEEVIRIWADGNLIYDKYNPDNDEIVSPGFTTEEAESDGKSKSLGKGKGSAGGSSGRFKFRFYKGDEEQLQDPYMVSVQGATEVPAFRGLCYLMFEDFSIGDFANRVPTITAEVQAAKRVKPTVQSFSQLAASDAKNWGSLLGVSIDPVRQRVYVEQTNDTSGTDELRVFDLNIMDEIIVHDISVSFGGSYVDTTTGVNVIGTTTLTWANMVGTDAQGLLVVNMGSNGLAWFDPDSLELVAVWGEFNSGAIAKSDTKIPSTTNCTPFARLTRDGIVWYLAVHSLFQDIYIFDEQFNMVAYHGDDLSLATSTSQIIAGPPTGQGSAFFRSEQHVTNQHIRISRGNYFLSSTNAMGDWAGGGNLKEIDDPSVEVWRVDVDGGAGDTAVTYTTPFYHVPSDTIAMLYSVSSSDVDRDGTYLVKLNPVTSAVVFDARISEDRVVLPNPGIFSQSPIVTGHFINWYEGSASIKRFHTCNVTEETYTSRELPSTFPVETSSSNGKSWIDWRGASIVNVNGGAFDSSMVLVRGDRLAQTGALLPDILTDLVEKAGLDAALADTALITTTDIAPGYTIDNPTTSRAAAESLSKFFLFDGVESDNTIKFISRGQAASFSIAEDDMGELADGEAYEVKISQESKLPARASLSFIDVARDYQTNSASWSRPRSPLPVMRSRDRLDISLPLSTTAERAKRQVKKFLYALWAERESRKYILPWEYLKQDPTDVATVTLNDATVWEDRMLQMDIGLNYSVEVQAIAQRQASYVLDTTVSAGATGGAQAVGTRTVPPLTFAMIMDIPYIEDADNVAQSQGLYYFGFRPASAGFEYAALENQIEPQPWNIVGGSVYEVPWGRTVSEVPDPPNGCFAIDDTSVIKLRPGFDYTGVYTWAASAGDEPEASNAILIGNNTRGWELIYFRDVTVNGDGSVDISYMRRSRRGTDPYATGHLPGEYFMIVDVDGFMNSTYDVSLLGVDQNFRAASPGFLANLSGTVTKAMTGASLKPFAIHNFKRTEDTPSSDDIQITWSRRTRLGGRLVNLTGGEVPIHEETEDYEIYLLPAAIADEAAALAFDPSDTTSYTRKFDTVDDTLDYTAAMRTTDSHTGDADVYIIGYQVSAEVGRGFPGFATLTKIRTT